MELLGVLVNLFSDQNFLFRIILIVLIVIYGFFTLIVAVQISNLNRTLNQIGFSGFLNLLAQIHVLGALALLIFSVLFL